MVALGRREAGWGARRRPLDHYLYGSRTEGMDLGFSSRRKPHHGRICRPEFLHPGAATQAQGGWLERLETGPLHAGVVALEICPRPARREQDADSDASQRQLLLRSQEPLWLQLCDGG